jgi:hypothetical protein
MCGHARWVQGNWWTMYYSGSLFWIRDSGLSVHSHIKCGKSIKVLPMRKLYVPFTGSKHSLEFMVLEIKTGSWYEARWNESTCYLNSPLQFIWMVGKAFFLLSWRKDRCWIIFSYAQRWWWSDMGTADVECHELEITAWHSVLTYQPVRETLLCLPHFETGLWALNLGEDVCKHGSWEGAFAPSMSCFLDEESAGLLFI